MACCCVVTSTGSVKIIEQLGKFKKVAMPGLEFIVPCIDQVSGTLSMRLQQTEVACETKTKDNVSVVMKVSIQYQIIEEDQKIQDAHYRLTSPAQQVRAPRPRLNPSLTHAPSRRHPRLHLSPSPSCRRPHRSTCTRTSSPRIKGP